MYLQEMKYKVLHQEKINTQYHFRWTNNVKNWHFLSSFPKEDRVTLQKERLSYLQLNALMPGYFITVAGLQLTQTIFLHSL